jgi:hypothetical protein
MGRLTIPRPSVVLLAVAGPVAARNRTVPLSACPFALGKRSRKVILE